MGLIVGAISYARECSENWKLEGKSVEVYDARAKTDALEHARMMNEDYR